MSKMMCPRCKTKGTVLGVLPCHICKGEGFVDPMEA